MSGARGGGQTVTHDADGNMVRGPLPTTGAIGNYTYDSRNRLTNAGGFAYRYNAEGNRVGLTSANETTTLTADAEVVPGVNTIPVVATDGELGVSVHFHSKST